MGGTGRKKEPPKNSTDTPKQPVRKPVDDDEFEDGDFATPKHDHTGNDDEPL